MASNDNDDNDDNMLVITITILIIVLYIYIYIYIYTYIIIIIIPCFITSLGLLRWPRGRLSVGVVAAREVSRHVLEPLCCVFRLFSVRCVSYVLCCMLFVLECCVLCLMLLVVVLRCYYCFWYSPGTRTWEPVVNSNVYV